MKNVVIIGGNHGLGLEWVKYYLEQGDQVTTTYRDLQASEGLMEIKNNNLTILQCDVTDIEDIKALASNVNEPDLIIYNAGTKGYKIPFTKPIDNTPEELRLALQVNCEGLTAAIQAFFPKLIARPNVMFVYMSTGVSSTLDNAGGKYLPYRISKAGGNSSIRTLDIAATEAWLEKGNVLEQRPLLFALTPGFVDIGMAKGLTGTMPVKQAISNMVSVMQQVLDTQDTHGLWAHTGKKIEEYVIPTVILKHQEKLATKNEEAPVKAYTPLLVLEKGKSQNTVSVEIEQQKATPKKLVKI